MSVTYTATFKNGDVVTRTSRGDNAQRYHHAWRLRGAGVDKHDIHYCATLRGGPQGCEWASEFTAEVKITGFAAR